MKSILNKAILIIAVLFVLAFYLGQSCFIHTHISDNGEIITHSHPFKSNHNSDSKGKNHSHTTDEILLLSSFDNTFIKSDIKSLFNLIAKELKKNSKRFIVLNHKAQFLDLNLCLRGPPSRLT